MGVGATLSISLPMLMTSAMALVIGETGVILLGMFRPEAEVGYYSVAVRMATLTSFMLTAINTMAAPKFSELYHSGNLDELFRVAKKSTRLIFWTSAPILLGLLVLGKPVLWLMYGEEFRGAYPALAFLTLGQFVNSASGSTGAFLNMTGRQRAFRNIVAVAAVMNVGLNLLLIPSLGILGAALAGMATMASWNVAALVFIKRRHGRTVGYFPGLAGVAERRAA
jgi:O-antigen/teichoic acid export membrane protein